MKRKVFILETQKSLYTIFKVKLTFQYNEMKQL